MAEKEYVRIPASDLNRLLTCKLCLGYFQDAHTIPECMHTFCHACISEYFQRYNNGRNIPCPTCGAELGMYHLALSKIIYDRNIQSIVDKIFPPEISHSKFLQDQLQLQKHTSSSSSTRHGALDEDFEFMVRVIAYDTVDEALKLPSILKPTFRGKLDIGVRKIQKFVFARLSEDVQQSLQGIESIEVLFEESVLDSKSDLRSWPAIYRKISQEAEELALGIHGRGGDHVVPELPNVILHYRRVSG